LAIKRVTLARPHPAIVGDMVPFLRQQGIEVDQLTQLSDLPTKVTIDTDAVVISLAVTSTIRASVTRVLAQVMAANPNVVLIFSSELPLNKKKKNLLYVLNKYFKNIEIVGSGCPRVNTGAKKVLYIEGLDLADTERQSRLAELIHHW